MKKTLVAAAIALLSTVSTANAALIYTLQPIVTLVPGSLYEWTYIVTLAGDQKIATPGPVRNFGVIYDVGFLVPGSFTSTSLIGAVISLSSVVEFTTSPQPVSQAVPDSATIPNLRTEITGAANFAADTDIYRVVFRSLTDQTINGNQSGQSIKDAPGTGSDNTLAGNTVQLETPAPLQTTVPEPTSLVLLGSGLVGAAMRLRNRKKK